MTEQQVWNRLLEITDGNKYGAAALMGNLKAESNLNSSNLQQTYESKLGYSDSSYTKAVDSGSYGNFVNDSAGYGLAQWTYSSRKQGLLNYAKSRGQSVGSAEVQLDYLEKELTEGYPRVLRALKGATNVKEASDAVMVGYEGPKDQSASAKNKRASYGQSFLDAYGNSSGSGIDSLSSGDSSLTSGDPALSDLSDVTLEVEPDNINDICAKWESEVMAVDISSVDIAGTFSPLTNAGVGTSYIPSLENAFKRAETMILSVSATIKAAAEEQAGVDEQYQGQDQGNVGSYYSSGGGSYYSGGGSSSGGSTSGVPTIEPLEPNPDTSVDNTDQDITVNTDFVSKINQLDAESYIEFMTVLGSISKGKLLSYITDVNCASDLKKALLETPNLDNDLKQAILQMDEKELQVTLQSILTDENVMTDISKSIIYSYTESLSQNTNIDVLKVSKEMQFFNTVDDLFNSVSTLIKSENLQENLLVIYDGSSDVNTISEESANFIRIAVDKICESKNVKYEEMLTDSANLNTLKSSLTDLSKGLSYFRTVNTMGSEAAQLLFKNVIKEG